MALDGPDLLASAWVALGALALAAWAFRAGVHDAGPDERIVIYRGDRVHRVRGPGLVVKWPLLEGMARIDMRARHEQLEVPAAQAASGAWIAATLRVDHVVLQPEKAAEVARLRYLGAAVTELVEAAFREVAGQLAPEAMIEPRDRAQLGRTVKKVANETALAWGLDITSVEALEVREIAAPSEGAAARWQVVLEDAGDRPIEVLRVVREGTGLGLKDAKDLVDAAPAALPGAFDVAGASRLRHLLEQAGARASFGLPAAADAVAAMGPAPADAVDVMLRASGDRVIEVIKALRRVTGWDLAHAKAVVEQAPYAIMHRVRRADAEEVRRALEAAGATVELV